MRDLLSTIDAPALYLVALGVLLGVGLVLTAQRTARSDWWCGLRARRDRIARERARRRTALRLAERAVRRG